MTLLAHVRALIGAALVSGDGRPLACIASDDIGALVGPEWARAWAAAVQGKDALDAVGFAAASGLDLVTVGMLIDEATPTVKKTLGIVRRTINRRTAAQISQGLPAAIMEDRAAEPLSRVLRLVAGVEEEGEARALDLIPAEDLLEATIEDVEWIMPGWAWPDIHLLAAPGGTSKSLYTFSVAISMAAGAPILGEWMPTRPARVLVIQEEDPPDLSTLRVQRLCAGMGIGPGDLEGRLLFTPFRSGFWFGDQTAVAGLRVALDKARPDLILFDSVSKVANIPDQNKKEDVRGFFRDQIEPLARDYGCGVACVHHTNKKAHELNPTVEQVATITGSQGFVDACDSVALISGVRGERDQRQFAWAKVRRGAKPHPWRYRICDQPGPGAPERRPVALMYEGPATADDEGGRTEVRRVLQFLRDNQGRRYNTGQLVSTLGVSRFTVARVRLIDGVGYQAGVGRKLPAEYWWP